MDQSAITQTPPATRRLAIPRLTTARLGLIALVLGLLGYPLVFNSPYPQHVAIMVFLYATLSQGWNVLGGYLGQCSLGNAIFFGAGAYTSTLLLIHLGLSPWIGMLAGIVVAVAISQLVGIPTFRLAGHYFAIASLALGEIAFAVAVNTPVLGRAIGLWPPLLPDGLVNFQFHGSKLPYYYLALGLCACAFLAVYFMERSRLGYYFQAIKGDLAAARSLGINATLYKSVGIAITATLSAAAGTLYAQYVLFIDPESAVATSISILILLVSVLGGTGSLWGPALGAVVLIPLSEITRVALGGTGKAIDLVLYSALIMIMAVYQPLGLAGLIKRMRRR